MAAADFNGDGKPDIVTTVTAGIGVFLNGVQNPPPPPQGTCGSTSTVLLATYGTYWGFINLRAQVSSAGGAVPTGTVTFYENGNPVVPNGVGGLVYGVGGGMLIASGMLTGLQAAPGTNNFSASFSGTGTCLSSQSNTLTVTLNKWPTLVPAYSVQSSQNPVVVGQAVNFSEIIAIYFQDVVVYPTGLVTFTADGSTVLAQLTWQPDGQHAMVVLPVNNLSPGTHQIVASYAGDNYYAAGTSGVLVQAVNTANQALGIAPAGPSTLTVNAGQSASYILSIGGQGFTGMATLTCTLPVTGTTCNVPASMSVGNTPSTFTVTVATNPRTGASLQPHGNPWFAFAFFLPAAGMFLAGKGRKRGLVALFAILLLIPLLILGCGGGGGVSGSGAVSGGGSPAPNPVANGSGTPAGTYDFAVTAQGGNGTQSAILTLKVN